MRLTKCVVFRLMVLGLCIAFAASPVIAGQAAKPANEDKAVKTGKQVKTEKAITTVPVEKKEAPKGNVAVVNGTAITQDDFDREILGVEEQSVGRGEKLDEARLSEIKKRILDKLIDSELLYQESLKMGFKVDDSLVDEQVVKLKGQFPNEEEFIKELAKAKLTEASLKNQIKQVMTIQQLIDKEFVQKITVSEEELKAFYEAHLKSRIEQNMKQEKIQTEVASYLEKLREKAKIERNLP
jgi:hypothetical protein